MLKKLRLRFRALFFKPRLEEELDEEMRFHLKREIEENITRGMSPEEASLAALRSFGGVERVKEESRDERGIRLLEEIWQDLRYSALMLRRSPGFTLVAILTLAFGIGANTAVFSVIDALLLKNLPVKDPEQLVLLTRPQSRTQREIFSSDTYVQFRDRDQTLAGLLAYYPLRLNVSVDGQPEPAITGQLVTGNYYGVLGVNAAIGRTITPDDDQMPGAHPVCVISDSYWERRFGRDLSIVGRAIHIGGFPFTIIGVTPPEFFGLEVGSSMDISVPSMMRVQAMPGSTIRDINNQRFHVVGRLPPGIAIEQAQASLELLYQQLMNDRLESQSNITSGKRPKPFIAEDKLLVTSASQGLSALRRKFSQTLIYLMSLVALVLLIACANVAGLTLSRAIARRKEMAVRLALGAGRLRLVRQVLTESLLLAGLGGLLGLLFAWWGTRLLLPMLSSGEMPVYLGFTPDIRVLGFTTAAAVLTGVLFGLVPAFSSTRVNLQDTLKNDSQRSSGHSLRLSFGQVFVIAQVALSLLLLVGAGLFVQSLQNLRQVDTGFARENVLVLKLEPVGSNQKTSRLAALYDELLRRLEAIPAVRMASLVSYSPISPREWVVMGQNSETRVSVSVQGYTPNLGEEMEIQWMQVYPNSFATLGIPLLAGRDFSMHDKGHGRRLHRLDGPPPPRVAIINESMASRFFANENPIGRRFAIGNSESSGDIEIVGLVKDVRYTSLRDQGRPMFYLPFYQAPTGRGQMTLVAQVAGDPHAVIAAIRREARGMDEAMPIFEVETLEAQMNASLVQERLVAKLSSAFGLLALLLACIGLYGIMAYDVIRRTHEIGVRMALGAESRTVVWLVLRNALRLALFGVALGIPATLAAIRFVSQQLYGVNGADPLTIISATLILLMVAVLAGYLPARRAARVDPMVALRYD